MSFGAIITAAAVIGVIGLAVGLLLGIAGIKFAVEVDEKELNRLGVGVIKADLITKADALHHEPQKLCDSVMRIVYGMKGR